MHEVNQFLEQDEVSWNHANAWPIMMQSNCFCLSWANRPLPQSRRNRSGKCAAVVANSIQTFLVGSHSRYHSCGVHAGKGGEVP